MFIVRYRARFFAYLGCEPNRAMHPLGSSVRRAARAPAVVAVPPQKNVGTAPRPRLCLTDPGLAINWRHRLAGSRRRRCGCNELGWRSGAVHSDSWLISSVYLGSARLAIIRPSGETALHIEGLSFLEHVVAGARELVRERLGGDDGVGLCPLAI